MTFMEYSWKIAKQYQPITHWWCRCPGIEVQSQVEADSPHIRCCHCDLVRPSEGMVTGWFTSMHRYGLGNHGIDWAPDYEIDKCHTILTCYAHNHVIIYCNMFFFGLSLGHCQFMLTPPLTIPVSVLCFALSSCYTSYLPCSFLIHIYMCRVGVSLGLMTFCCHFSWHLP